MGAGLPEARRASPRPDLVLGAIVGGWVQRICPEEAFSPRMPGHLIILPGRDWWGRSAHTASSRQACPSAPGGGRGCSCRDGGDLAGIWDPATQTF